MHYLPVPIYLFEGKVGKHTRLSGISREKQKELIIKHFEKNEKGFMKDFEDIFPELKAMDISNLLRELKKEKKLTMKVADALVIGICFDVSNYMSNNYI